MRKREYVMRERQDAVEERRLAVLGAAHDLFREAPYDEVSLQSIADEAGVSLKTVVRQFGTKEGLLAAVAKEMPGREFEERRVARGDVAGVAAILAERYELLARANMRLLELEGRMEVIAQGLKAVRLRHRDWLAATFADSLPARGAERERRLACLFGATEIYVWVSWRKHLGLSREDAEAAMRDSLQSLVDAWKRRGTR